MRKVLLAIVALVLAVGLALPVATATAANGGDVSWFAEDTETQGDWYFNPVGSPIGVYGSYAYILPNPPGGPLQYPIGKFSVPTGFKLDDDKTWEMLLAWPYNWASWQIAGLPFYKPDPTYWDEYQSQDPPVEYWVSGTKVDSIQYPVFEWAWYGFNKSQTDAREVYYPEEGKWRLACWDDGGERCRPEHGYMDFHLTFPEGAYLLSLYAYDYETVQRESQEYRILDETGNQIISKQISGDDFDEGVYEIFKVVAPRGGLSIIVRVYNDAGHKDWTFPPGSSINVLLSGIFVDKVSSGPPGTGTPGYWKNHPEAWPVDNITIGGETYTRKEAIKFMNMPDAGDKTYTMFQALVAAKLNVFIGNDASCIIKTILDADAWMVTNSLGSGVKTGGKNSPWRQGEPLYMTLDDYNNGLLCAPSRDSLE